MTVRRPGFFSGSSTAINKVVDNFIDPEQYKGNSFDGQYFNLGVEKHLDEHYGAPGQPSITMTPCTELAL